MYPSFVFGARRLRSVHPRFSVSEKICPPNDPLNHGNLHELKLRLKIVRTLGSRLGVRFSFSLQDYFHNLYVFMEIYKIMFYFVSKYLRHCVGSTKVLCLHCHCNPHRPGLASTCCKNLLQ